MAPGQEHGCLTYVDGSLHHTSDDWTFIQNTPTLGAGQPLFGDAARSVDNLLACLPQHPCKLPSTTMFDSPGGPSEFWGSGVEEGGFSLGFPLADPPQQPLDPTAVSVSAGPLLCDIGCQLPCCAHGRPYSPSALSFNPSDVSSTHSPLSVAESFTHMPMYDSHPNVQDTPLAAENSPSMMVVPHVSIAFSPPTGPVLGDHGSLDQLTLPPSLASVALGAQLELARALPTPPRPVPPRARSKKRVQQHSKPQTVLNKRHSISKGRSRQSPKPDKSSRRFCHICRSAKELSKIVACCSGKQSHVFCSSCVARRLDLSFDELVQRDDWLCPKCLDECPCSKCRPRIRD